MRILSLFAAPACTTVCPGHETLDGDWRVTSQILAAEGADDPGFPSYHSPSNGVRSWTITWGRDAEGDVSLWIDGQPMTAEGRYDQDECGMVLLAVGGTYVGPNGSRHSFGADAELQVWGDTMVGEWTYNETWLSPDQTQSGALEAEASLQATRAP